jgi:hypothetical protein
MTTSLQSLLLPENGFETYRGERRILAFEVTEPDTNDPTKEVPTDLTDYKVWFTVKLHPESKEVLFQYTSDDITEIDIPNPLDGVAIIYIAPADTRSLDPGDYYYDVWIQDTVTGDPYLAIRPSIMRVLSGVTLIEP